MGQDSVFLWLYIVTCSLFLFPLNHLGGALPSLCTLTHRHPPVELAGERKEDTGVWKCCECLLFRGEPLYCQCKR